MALPEQFLEMLRLSKSPAFARLKPQQASAFAQMVGEFLASPEMKEKLTRLGGPSLVARAAGVVDVPTSPEAIASDRAKLRGGANRGVGTRVGEGFANTFNRMGLGDILADLAGGLSGGGFTGGAPVQPFQPLPEESMDLPLLGSQDPVALASEIAGFLPIAVGAVGAGGAAIPAGMAASSPALASTAAFALGGGALEAATQGIRAARLGEEIDPVQVLIEAGVFGAGGVPIGGGALASRLGGALLAGGAAAGLPALLGREVDPGRVAAEAVFGGLFGNPRVEVRGGSPKPFEFKDVPPPTPKAVREVSEALNVPVQEAQQILTGQSIQERSFQPKTDAEMRDLLRFDSPISSLLSPEIEKMFLDHGLSIPKTVSEFDAGMQKMTRVHTMGPPKPEAPPKKAAQTIKPEDPEAAAQAAFEAAGIEYEAPPKPKSEAPSTPNNFSKLLSLGKSTVEVVRGEEAGFKIARPESKPQGLYVTPKELFDKTLRPELKTFKTFPANIQNLLNVSTVDTGFLPLRGGVSSASASTGIKALKQLVGDQSFAELVSLASSPKRLSATLQKLYPDVKWDQFHDGYEMLEGLAGVKAREQGFDAMTSGGTDAFAEVVLLKNSTISSQATKPRGKSAQAKAYEADAKAATDPLQAMILEERAKAIEVLRDFDEVALEQGIRAAESEVERQLFLDALAARKGEVRVAPDAPAEKQLPEKQYGIQMAHNAEEYVSKLAAQASDPNIFRNPMGDPAQMADTVLFKLLRAWPTPEGKPLKSAPAKMLMELIGPNRRLELATALEEAKEMIRVEAVEKGLKQPSDAEVAVAAAERIKFNIPAPNQIEFTPIRPIPTTREGMRQHLIDMFLLDEADIGIRRNLAEADGAPSTLKGQLEASLRAVQEQKAQLEDPVAPMPPIPDIETAFDLFLRMVGDGGEKKARQLLGDLDDSLKPHQGGLERMWKLWRAEETRLASLEKTDDAALAKIVEEAGAPTPETTPQTGTVMDLQSKKTLTFTDIQAEAGAKGARLTKEGSSYVLTHGGQRTEYPSLGTLRKGLKNIQAMAQEATVPKNVTAPEVELAGRNKAVKVTHVGEGKYQTTNQITGERMTHPNLESAAHRVAQTEVPAAPDLTPSAPNMPGTGGIGTSVDAGKISFDIPPLDPTDFPGGFGNIFNTMGELMKRMEDATGQPLWTRGWEPGIRASEARDGFVRPLARDLRQIFSRVKTGRYNVVQDLLIAGKEQAAVRRHYSATKAEVEAARRLRNWYKEVLSLENPAQIDRFLDAVRALRRESGDPTRAFEGWNMPGELSEMMVDILRGNLSLSGGDARVIASEVMASVGRNRFMRPVMRDIFKLNTQLKSRSLKPDVSQLERKHLNVMVKTLDDFVDSLLYGTGTRGKATADILNASLSKFRKWGLLKEEVKPADVDRWASEMASYVSGSALSARPFLALRNFFQRTLVANRVGWDVTLSAQKKLHTPEGKMLVEESGVMGQQVDWYIDDIGTLLSGQAGAKQALLRMQSAGMYLYKKADMGNRGHNYLAGVESIQRHAPLLREGKVNEFLLETGLALESNTNLRRVLGHLHDVDASEWDSAVRRAGDEYGKRLVEEHQFIYHRANAPLWMQSVTGRMFGQFGLWPMAFTEMSRRGLAGLTSSNPIRRKASKRWLTRMVAQLGAISAAGYALGIDTSSFNKANPLAFEGGPLMNLVRDVGSLALGTETEFGRQIARRNIERALTTLPVPFGGAVLDAQQALEQHSPMDALLTILGATVEDKN